MGQLLPGGRYQADDGFVYPNYQAAANRGQELQAIQNAGSSILRGLSNPLGLVNQYEAARKRGFGVGRPASAAGQPTGRPEGSQAVLNDKPVQWAIENGKGSWVKDYQTEGDMMREIFAEQAAKRAGSSATLDLRGAPPAPILPSAGSRTPITSPNTTFQNADDEYNRLKSQFGGTTGVSQLAGMASLPTGFTPTGGKQAAGLKDYYAAQQEVGERNIGEITSALGYQKGSPMEQWARQHQGLAMEVFNKKFPAGAPTQGPSDDAIRSAISGGKFYPSEGSPSPVTNPPDFGTPANAVPAPPMQQGGAVSAPFVEAQRQAAQKTAGATGMPNFGTTPEAQAAGKNFLGKALSSPWGQALMNTGGAMVNDYMQGIR